MAIDIFPLEEVEILLRCAARGVVPGRDCDRRLRSVACRLLTFEVCRTLDDVAAYFHTRRRRVPQVSAYPQLNGVSLAELPVQLAELADALVLRDLPRFHVDAVYFIGLAPL
jgi:hypothetical protein